MAFNKEKNLIGTFSDHCKTSRSPVDSSNPSPSLQVGTPVTVPRSVFTSSNPLLANNKFSPRHQDTAALATQLQNKLVLSSHAR